MKLPVVQIDKLNGGVNKLVSQTRVAKNESPDLLNIEFTEDGLPSKRRGFVAYGNEVGTNNKGLGSFYKSDGTKIHLKVTGGKLYKYLSGLWTEVTGATFATDNVNFLQAKNAIYILDGTGIKKYDGTTLSTVTSSPNASYGIFYGGRVITAGDSTNTSRLNMSAPDNPDGYGGSEGTATSGSTTTIVDTSKSWTVNQLAGFTVYIEKGTNTGQSRVIQSNTSNTITVASAYGTAIDNTSQYSVAGGDSLDVSKDDGQKVMGLGKFEEKLLVFKERSTYQLTFDSTNVPIVQQISNAVGCVSHRTVESVENDVFYLSNDGVRTFGYVANIPNVIRTNKLSSKIEPEIQNINWSHAEQSCAIYHDNKYILCVPSGVSTTNDRMLVFQLLYGCWTIWDNINANCFNEFVDTDNKLKLYFGDEKSGNVFELLKGYNDNGAAIEAYWFSPQFDLGQFSIFKKIKFIDLQ